MSENPVILESEQDTRTLQHFTQESAGIPPGNAAPSGSTEGPNLEDLYVAGLHRLQRLLEDTDGSVAIQAFMTIHQLRQEAFWLKKQEDGELPGVPGPRPAPLPVYIVPNPDGTDSSEQEVAASTATKKRGARSAG